MSERCEIRRCRAEASITYLDHGVCERHWNQLTAEDAPPEALRIALGIEATVPAAVEDTTMEPTPGKTQKTVTAAPPVQAKNPKPGKKTKEPKEPKAKKEKAPRQPLVVFAFRLTAEERDRIHKAAGPGNASKFVLAAALAVASGDSPALEELLAAAKASRR